MTLAKPEHEWMTSFVHKRFLPLQIRLELLEQDKEIFPGISTIIVSGHTPGQMALVIASSGEELLSLGDVITHPIHLEEPERYIESDCQPEQAVRTRLSWKSGV